MNQRLHHIAARLLNYGAADLHPADRQALERIAADSPVSRDSGATFEDQLSLGQRLADRVAAFGGSWTFIGLFAGVLVGWVILNSALLARWNDAFDPYPYILLNLFLSMLAAIQAPVIMMSQNRQASKDRLQAQLDYQVNLKAELEIARLHERIDAIRAEELHAMLLEVLDELRRRP